MAVRWDLVVVSLLVPLAIVVGIVTSPAPGNAPARQPTPAAAQEEEDGPVDPGSAAVSLEQMLEGAVAFELAVVDTTEATEVLAGGYVIDGDVVARLLPALAGSVDGELRIVGDLAHARVRIDVDRLGPGLGWRQPEPNELRAALADAPREIRVGYVSGLTASWVQLQPGASTGVDSRTADGTTLTVPPPLDRLIRAVLPLASVDAPTPMLATPILRRGQVSQLVVPLGGDSFVRLRLQSSDDGPGAPSTPAATASIQSLSDLLRPLRESERARELIRRFNAGGYPEAVAALRAVAAAEQAVLAREGGFTEDPARLDRAGLRRPPFTSLHLCTYDGGAGFAAATERAGPGGVPQPAIIDSAWAAPRRDGPDARAAAGCDPFSG